MTDVYVTCGNFYALTSSNLLLRILNSVWRNRLTLQKAKEDRKHEQQSEEQRKKETHREKKQQNELWPNNKQTGQVQFTKQQHKQALLQEFVWWTTDEPANVWWVAEVLERSEPQSTTWIHYLPTPRKVCWKIQQTHGPFCQILGEGTQKIGSTHPPKASESLGFRPHSA